MTEAAISFAGNLTQDPEVRYTEAGIARAMFRVAVSGRREQEASFFTVVVWRDQAEHAAESLARAAGSWSWADSSSGAGRRRTGAPARWSRSWPMSWGRAFVERRRRRPRQPAASSQLALEPEVAASLTSAASGGGERPFGRRAEREEVLADLAWLVRFV